jgi:hypothetical protein
LRNTTLNIENSKEVLSKTFKEGVSNGKVVGVQVFKDSRIKSLNDYVNIFYNGDLSSNSGKKNIKIGGLDAISYQQKGGITASSLISVVVHNGLYYEFKFENNFDKRLFVR